jgi:hypothetical protein
MILEASAHGNLTLCFWVEALGRENYSPHGGWKAKRRYEQGPDIPLKGMPPVT